MSGSLMGQTLENRIISLPLMLRRFVQEGNTEAERGQSQGGGKCTRFLALSESVSFHLERMIQIQKLQ